PVAVPGGQLVDHGGARAGAGHRGPPAAVGAALDVLPLDAGAGAVLAGPPDAHRRGGGPDRLPADDVLGHARDGRAGGVVGRQHAEAAGVDAPLVGVGVHGGPARGVGHDDPEDVHAVGQAGDVPAAVPLAEHAAVGVGRAVQAAQRPRDQLV